jgi:copper chaperone CopZ
MATLKLTVAGMHCGHCKMKVEKALQGITGTSGVAVFLEDGAAEVDYDPGQATAEQYVAAVREAGYQATPDA